MNRILKYINVFTAQVIVFVLFLALLIKIQWVIFKIESQLKNEKSRALFLDSTLASLNASAYLEKKDSHVKAVQKPDTVFIKTVIAGKPDHVRPDDSLKKPFTTQDTVNKAQVVKITPKSDSVKNTYLFYGSVDEPLKINKLLSIVKVELMLALASYDSLYQYTKYLGLTKWKLTFVQKRVAQPNDEISVFRIGKAHIDNNQLVTCQFIEELRDDVFNQAARLVNFKGIISHSTIAGELSWIDRSDGGMVPVKIPFELTRK